MLEKLCLGLLAIIAEQPGGRKAIMDKVHLIRADREWIADLPPWKRPLERIPWAFGGPRG